MPTQPEAISARIDGLRQTFASGLTRPLDWRKQQLKSLQRLLTEQQSVITDALYEDLGKSAYESFSAEIGFVASEAGHALKHLGRWSRQRKVPTPLLVQPGKSFLLPEPLGTVLIIGAWNYPIQLTLGPAVAAIAAGNCVLLKPSEVSTHCAALLCRLLPQYLDDQAIQVIAGGVPETTEILNQPFDHILYTGGEGVARIVMRAAAEHLTPVTLELGGKSPCIVDDTAELAVTASRIVWSKWMNAGQTCVAPDYVIATRDRADALIEALEQTLQSFYGSNTAANADYGRIINERHLDRLVAYLEGQQIVLGGQIDHDQRFMAPTIVRDPALDSPLMQEEIFGPILPVITVDEIDQAIGIINQRPKPLSLYLYTQDRKLEARVLSETSAGSVAINDGMMFMANPNLPFGGVGASGMGRYHGQFGFDTFSHLKSVIKRSTIIDPPLRYPPYTEKKLGIVKKLL